MARQVRLKPRKHLALNTEEVLQSPQQCIMFNNVEGSTQIEQDIHRESKTIFVCENLVLGTCGF